MAMRLAVMLPFLYSTPIVSAAQPDSRELEVARERLLSLLGDLIGLIQRDCGEQGLHRDTVDSISEGPHRLHRGQALLPQIFPRHRVVCRLLLGHDRHEQLAIQEPLQPVL